MLDNVTEILYTRCMRGIIRERGPYYYIDFHYKGKRFRIYSDDRGITLDSYAFAERVLEAIRYEVDCGRFDPQKYLSRKKRDFWIKTRLEVWLEQKEREGLSKAYLQELRGDVRRYILSHFKPTTNVRDIQRYHIAEFARKLVVYSPKTRRNILGTLRTFFTHLTSEGWVEEVPPIPAVDVPERAYTWLDRGQQLDILCRVSSRVRPPLMFLIYQGLRPGEVVALKWKDVNLQKGILTVSRSWSRGRIVPTKTKRIRSLPMHPEVEGWCREQGKHMPEAFLFEIKDPRYIRQEWNRACKEVGIDCRLYDGTRHSLASQAVNAGVPLNLIQDTLGHTSEKMTRRYAHLDVSALKAVIHRDNVKRFPHDEN